MRSSKFGVSALAVIHNFMTAALSSKISNYRCLLITALLVAVTATRAGASNEDDFFVGDRAAMTGGAVTATVADGSAAFYNHAGLAMVTRDRFDVNASAYALRFYSVPNFLKTESGKRRNASVTEFVAIPTAVAYVRQLGKGIVLGLGYFVPRAENALLSSRLKVADTPLDSSTWALDLRSSEASYWLVAALGMRLREYLRIGFGLFGVYDSSVTSTALFGSAVQNQSPQKGIQLSSLSTSTRLSAALGVGVQIEISPAWTLSLWARGPRIQLFYALKESINEVNAASDQNSATPLRVFSDTISGDSGHLGFVSLGRYYLGLARRFGDTSLSAEVDFQPGLRSSRTGTDRVFTVNARAGATYPIANGIVLGAGVFSDRSTGPSSSASRANFYGATAGIELSDLFGLARGERSDNLVLTTAFAFRYAFGSGSTDTLFINTNGDFTIGGGSGRSTQSIHELGLHIGSGLRF